jgi:hypothetical protein
VRSRRHPPGGADGGRERHRDDQQHGNRIGRPPRSADRSSGAPRVSNPFRGRGDQHGQLPGGGVIHPVRALTVTGLYAVNHGSDGGSPRRAGPSRSRPPQPQRRGKGEQRHCDCSTTSDPPHPSRLCEPRTWTKRPEDEKGVEMQTTSLTALMQQHLILARQPPLQAQDPHITAGPRGRG